MRPIDADRAAHNKKPFKRDDDAPPPGKVSRTDPESGYMVRDDKPRGFFYLDHRTVDARYSIITDTHVHARFGARQPAVSGAAGSPA